MKKMISTLLTFVLIATIAITAFAGPSDQANCPHRANHGNHSASTMEYHLQVNPDIIVGQLHLIEYWYCTNCTFVCWIRDEYFGNVINTIPENAEIH